MDYVIELLKNVSSFEQQPEATDAEKALAMEKKMSDKAARFFEGHFKRHPTTRWERFEMARSHGRTSV
jgi:hypothetical protein